MLSFMLSSGRQVAAWLGCVLWLFPASIGLTESAAEADAVVAPKSSSGEPAIDLDLLLKLPESYVASGERRGGASRSEWRARFFEASERLSQRQDDLARFQGQMEGMAGDSSTWSVGAPGLGNSDPKNSTLSYKLRQDIRRAREEIDEAERALRELRIQADLADVPGAWRE